MARGDGDPAYADAKGAGAGAPAVLLFPGALGRAASVRPALDHLARRRRAIALDHALLPLHPERLAEEIEGVLVRERCHRAHFVGFSLGAELARQTALLAPGLCRSLVLVGAGAPNPRRGRRVARVLPLLRLAPAFLLRRRWRVELEALLREPSGDQAGNAAAHERLLGLVRRMTRRELVAARERLVVTDLCAIADRPVPAAIPALRVDFAKDEVVPRAERGRLAQLVPHATVEELPGLGHGATLTLPLVLLERIEAWCARR